MSAETFAFGTGALVVDTGLYEGRAAVFIRRSATIGPVGERAEDVPLDCLQPGEQVLTFPTSEHAKRVADVLVTPSDTPASAAKGEAVAWWCERPDGTGFSVDIDPGHWPNLTVHRLFKDTQPHPSQQAGTAQWLSMAVATLRQIDHPEARAFLVGYDAALSTTEVAG